MPIGSLPGEEGTRHVWRAARIASSEFLAVCQSRPIPAKQVEVPPSRPVESEVREYLAHYAAKFESMTREASCKND